MIVDLSLGVIAAAAVGGAAGALSRFLLDNYLRSGVLIANTLGALLLGVLVGVSASSALGWSQPFIGLVAVGFLGALTTFSTVSLRAAEQWLSGFRWKAIGLWALHTGCGVAAAAAGLALGWLLGG